MQGLKQVKNRIRAIDDIARITGALEIVALTRLKKRQDTCVKSRLYFDKIRTLLNDITRNINFYNHPLFLNPVPENKVGFIIVGSDKGLCGSFNYNIYNALYNKRQEIGLEVFQLAVFGRRLLRLLKAEARRVVFKENASEEKDLNDKIFSLNKQLIKSFLEGKINSLYLIYNHFHQHLIGKANIIKLLPLELSKTRKDALVRDYIYQPAQEKIFEALVNEYLFIQILHALLESRVSEEMARMVAMKQATDNAKELLSKLSLDYHKLRQMGITRELLDIMQAMRG